MAEQIKSIETDGYRGKETEFRFLPAGVYELGSKTDAEAGVIKRTLGEFLVAIGKAGVVETVQPAPKRTPKATKLAPKSAKPSAD